VFKCKFYGCGRRCQRFVIFTTTEIRSSRQDENCAANVAGSISLRPDYSLVEKVTLLIFHWNVSRDYEIVTEELFIA
jgi:hypothetical protein